MAKSWGSKCGINYFLHSMGKKVDFSPILFKKEPFYLELDTFKVILLLSYLASLDNKPRT